MDTMKHERDSPLRLLCLTSSRLVSAIGPKGDLPVFRCSQSSSSHDIGRLLHMLLYSFEILQRSPRLVQVELHDHSRHHPLSGVRLQVVLHIELDWAV